MRRLHRALAAVLLSGLSNTAAAQMPILGVSCVTAELPAGIAKKLGRAMIGPAAGRIADLLAPRAGLHDVTGAIVWPQRSTVTVLWLRPGAVCPMAVEREAWGRAERAVLGVEG